MIRALPLIGGLAVLVTLGMAVGPVVVAEEIRGFRVLLVPMIAALVVAYYVVQGVRWYPLLRSAGVGLRLRDCVGLNLAGQATSLLPLGELARALFVSRFAQTSLPAAVATVAVQELQYALAVLLLALPASTVVPGATGGLIVAAIAAALALAVLGVRRVFAAVRKVLVRIAVLRRGIPALDRLQASAAMLLRRPDTALWSMLSIAGAILGITAFWLVVEGLAPGAVSWQQAAFVYGAAHVVAGVSLVPGGLGVYEVGGAGLLTVLGVEAGSATAAVLLGRAAQQGIGTTTGAVMYLCYRHRIGGLDGR